MSLEMDKEIREIAQSLLNSIAFEEPPVDIEKIVKSLSIPVIDYPFFSDDTSGIIVNDKDLLAIGVNQNHPLVRKRFTIAHELGHFILGHDSASFVDHKFDATTLKERQANLFAAVVLMPIQLLEKDLNEKKWNIPSLAQRYMVSEQAMSIRLVENKLISHQNFN